MTRQYEMDNSTPELKQARTTRFRRASRAVLVGVAALAAMVSTAAVTSAAPAPSAPKDVSTVVETPLRFGGYDAAVAAANGYEIRTTPDGAQYSVKKGTLTGVIAQDVVNGNCGSSWVWLTAQGNRSVIIDTGFRVRDAVATFSWTVTLDDSGGTTKHDFPGFYDADGLVELKRFVPGLTVGPAAASVTPFANFAILVDGAVCFSGGPTDPDYIY